MIEQIISGGQTGVDQAAWRTAKSVGIPTGGWMPRGFLTEDGKRPEFAELYGAKEHSDPGYPMRTYQNVHDSHGTVWLGSVASAGYKCTHSATRKYRTSRPIMVAYDGCHSSPPLSVAEWIAWHDLAIVNVAGNRESSAPGIGAWAEVYLTEIFRLLISGGK